MKFVFNISVVNKQKLLPFIL